MGPCGPFISGLLQLKIGVERRSGAIPIAENHTERVAGFASMATAEFEYAQAVDALSAGIDVVGLARALVLDPSLPNAWLAGEARAPPFPRFEDLPEGGVTGWYTVRMTELAEGRGLSGPEGLSGAIRAYEGRDATHVAIWNSHFKD